MTGGIIDRLVISLGLDASGLQKGRDDTRVALGDMRADARQAQAALSDLVAKQRQQQKDAAAEEERLAGRIRAIRTSSTRETRERDTREAAQLGRLLARKRVEHREQRDQTSDEILQQRKVVGAKQKGIKDTEKGEKDQAVEARKRRQGLRDEGNAVTALTRKVFGLFAAFTGGQSLASFIGGIAGLGRTADNLGVNIDDLRAWQGAVERVGGSAEDATGAIASLVKTRELLKAGQLPGDQAKVLNSFGITAQDLEDPIAAMLKMAEVKERLGMSNAQFSLRAGMLGFDQNAINAMMNGRKALEESMAEARRAGGPSEAQSKAAQELQRKWADLTQRAAVLALVIVERLAPALHRILDLLSQMADWASKNETAVDFLAKALGGLAAISFVRLIGSLAGLAGALSPIGIAVAGIVAGLAYMAKWRMDKDAEHAQANTNSDVEFRKAELARAERELAEREKSNDGGWGLFRVRTASHGQSGQTMESARAEVTRQKMMLAHAQGNEAEAWTQEASLRKQKLDTARKSGASEKELRALERSWRGAMWKQRLLWSQKWAGGAPVGGAGGGSGGLDSSVMAGLRQRGFSETQARGIAAGIHAESGSNPNARNPSSGAMGLGQWLGPRKKALLRRYGPNPTREQQLDFLAWELRGGDRGGAKVLAQTDEISVLDTYIDAFMRPAKGAETWGDKRRGRAALGRGVTASAPVRAATTPARAKAALDRGNADLEKQIADRPEAEKKAERAKYEANPKIVALRAAAAAPTPVSAEAAAPVTATPLGQAASLLSQAAQALLSAANTLQSPRGGATGYDRGLNMGARASYGSRVVSNDNSRRVEAQTHIGQVNLHGVRDAAEGAARFDKMLGQRAMAYMAASGLD